MRLVKLVKLVHTFMLQNQRLKKTLYRIDFNGNLYRIILDGLAQKVMNFDVFQSSDLDFVACKNLPCQTLCLWKVLDFVESRILAGRAEFDLVIGPFGTWPWGPLQNRGAQQGPPNCKGDPTTRELQIHRSKVKFLIFVFCGMLGCSTLGNWNFTGQKLSF